ncbi:MAG: EamA family transporter [Gemmatimonadota bacterium]
MDPRVGLVVAAFAAVYVVWGSTYLAIRFAIESIPPLFLGSVRFLIAGSLLYGWALVRGVSRPTRLHWRNAAIAGGLMLGGGNGAVVVAEQWVPSGLTAVLIACVPLWMVVFDAAFGSKIRPSGRAQLGLLVGFLGIILLTGAPGIGDGGLMQAVGVVLLIGASASWAAGSLYQRHVPVHPDPMLWVSLQMIGGGALLAVASALAGEVPDIHVGQMTGRSLAALGYLIVFGSLIAYSAYVWLLRVSTPARVGTYAYVNPVIALVLGWALAGEPISLRSIVAAAVVLASVIVIMSENRAAQIRGVRLRQVGR